MMCCLEIPGKGTQPEARAKLSNCFSRDLTSSMRRAPIQKTKEKIPGPVARHLSRRGVRDAKSALPGWHRRTTYPPRHNMFLKCALALCVLLFVLRPSAGQQVHLPPAKGQIAELSSEGPQKRQGDLF